MLMTMTPRSSLSARGVCFLTMLCVVCCASTAAQCSLATQPALSSGKPAESTQAAPPDGNAASSSSDTAAPLRFSTGTAITVLEGTPLQVINDMPISSRTTRAGDRISFTVTRDVVVDGVLVIPCGATAYGTIIAVRQAVRLVGSSNLTLQLTSLNLDGRSYPLYTPPFKVTSQSKTLSTTRKVTTGAAAGALAMDISKPPANYNGVCSASGTCTQVKVPYNRALADGIGAGAGAGIGTAIAAASPSPIALIPAESQMEFTLASPIAVFPVDQRTAARLAQGMHHGGPVLYIRGENQ